MTMSDTLQTRVKDQRNVVGFRPRDVKVFPEKPARNSSTNNIYELLDLSRYERRDDSPNASRSFQPYAPDDFKYRMRVNVAALIFLVALAGFAAADFLKLEQAQFVQPAGIAVARSDPS